MTTTVSIDFGAPVAGVGEVTVSSEAAAATAVTPAVGQNDATVQGFETAMAKTLAENAGLGEQLRSALKSLEDTLIKPNVPGASAETPAMAKPAVAATAAPAVSEVAAAPAVAELPATPVTMAQTIVANTAIASEFTQAVAQNQPATTAILQSSPETAVAATAVAAATAPTVSEVAAAPAVAELPATPVTMAQTIVANTAIASEFTQAVAQANPVVEAIVANVSKKSETVATDDLSATIAPQAIDVAVPVVQNVQAQAADDSLRVQAVDVTKAAFAAPALTPDQVLLQAAGAVADTLLVTPGLLRGQGEVVIQLKPDVLEGTQLQISVTGKQLAVVFQPVTVDMAVLIENCRPAITQHLAAKIAAFNVSVDVRKKRT